MPLGMPSPTPTHAVRVSHSRYVGEASQYNMAWHVVALVSGSCREAPMSDAHVLALARVSVRPSFLLFILTDIWCR